MCFRFKRCFVKKKDFLVYLTHNTTQVSFLAYFLFVRKPDKLLIQYGRAENLIE